MDKASLKKLICKAMAVSTTIEGLDKNDVIFLTPIGMVMGKPVSKDEVKKNVIFRVANDIEVDYRDTNNLKGTALPNNDGYICLENVTVRNLNSTYGLNSLILFYDQIIGVSLGSFD